MTRAQAAGPAPLMRSAPRPSPVGVVAEAPTLIAEPERRRVGQAMLSTEPSVAIEGTGGLRAEGHEPALPTLAAPDVQCASSQVDVLDSEGDRLAGSQSCLGEQSD
jgi:hypothetical protein